MTDTQKQFAKQLKKYRTDRKWTFKRMGEFLDLSPATVWKIENAKVKPQERTVSQITELIPQLAEVA